MVNFDDLINEEKHLSGSWKIPGFSRKKFQGNLILGKEKIELELHGEASDFGQVSRYHEVKGKTGEGVFILKQNYRRNLKTNGKNGAVLSLEPTNVIFFENYETNHSTDVSTLVAELPHLVFWIDSPLFKQNFTSQKITYEYQKEFKYKLDNLEVVIGSYLPTIDNWSLNESNKLTLEERGFIQLSFRKPLPYDEAINKFRDVEALFRFIYMQQFFTKSFNGHKILRPKNDSPGIGRKQIYYSRMINREIIMPNIVHQLFIFKLSDCRDFGAVLRKWINLKEKFEPVYQLLLMSNEPTVYIENQFMGLINACELFHRSFLIDKQEVKPENEWVEQKTQILELLKGKNRKLVKGLLKYSNEPTLEERLTDLVKRVSNTGFKGMMPKEINNIAVTRNNFIHKAFGEVSGDINLLEVDYALTELLAFAILLELGFKTEEINKFSRNRFLFRYSKY